MISDSETLLIYPLNSDLGGAQPARAPPLLKHFSINGLPPLLRKKKEKEKKRKKVSDSARLYPGCYLTPPPPPPKKQLLCKFLDPPLP